MQQITLSKWLKFILIGIALCGLVIYTVVFPALGQSIVTQNEEFSYCFWPWLIFIWVTGIPCYIAIVFAWRIATNIGADQSFSLSNAKLLKWIAILAAGDAAFFFIGNIIFLFLNMSHPGIVLISFIIVFAGVAISIASAALSHLVMKASVLQDQSDWTI